MLSGRAVTAPKHEKDNVSIQRDLKTQHFSYSKCLEETTGMMILRKVGAPK